MTNQQALDKMVAHFSQPGAKLSYDGEQEVCCYRTENGARCAVGCLIPSELYDEGFEGNSARMFSDLFETGNAAKFDTDMSAEATSKATKVGELLAGVEPQFLLDAQNAHDEWAVNDSDDEWAVVDSAVACFLEKLRDEVAPKYNLRWPLS